MMNVGLRGFVSNFWNRDWKFGDVNFLVVPQSFVSFLFIGERTQV